MLCATEGKQRGFPTGLQCAEDALLHLGCDVFVDAGHAGHLVTQPSRPGHLGEAVVGTGRERFTNRVEYLRSRGGEMRGLVLVDEFCRCPRCIEESREVTEADATSWRLSQRAPHTTMLTCGFSPSSAHGSRRARFWIPYGTVL